MQAVTSSTADQGANNQKLTATNTIKAPVPTKTALDAKSYVLIQSSADDSSSYSSVKAEILNPGTTLWANAYDGEAVPNKRIAAQGGWTYQWLASDTRDAEDSAYQVIPGQTGQSLTITDELASQLAGKYIRVKVVGDRGAVRSEQLFRDARVCWLQYAGSCCRE